MADYTLGHQVSGSLLSDVDADLRLGGLDDINVDSKVSGKLDSDINAKADAKVDGKLAATVRSDSDMHTDSKVVTDSRVASSVDLAPVAVDSCIRVELGSMPATEVHTPWEQRLGLSVLGVELFAWVLAGQTTTTLRPLPKLPQLIGSVEQVRVGHNPTHHPRNHDRPGRHDRPEAAERTSSGGLSIRLG
jgi:hypothetical protein